MGDRVPHRTLEIGQKASVEILGPPTQPVDAAVVVTEPPQIRVADAREPRQETVEARERFVAVARDRPPHVAFRCVEARPPPLIGMAIAVTEQEVEQARREERAGIHPLTRARSEEHTSELQSPCNLVCRLLLEKKKIEVNTTLITKR